MTCLQLSPRVTQPALIVCIYLLLCLIDGRDNADANGHDADNKHPGATADGSDGDNDASLRPRAGRMLSSKPFMDDNNNEWTLSLLPYGLADFAPKDLTDKATVCYMALTFCRAFHLMHFEVILTLLSTFLRILGEHAVPLATGLRGAYASKSGLFLELGKNCPCDDNAGESPIA